MFLLSLAQLFSTPPADRQPSARAAAIFVFTLFSFAFCIQCQPRLASQLQTAIEATPQADEAIDFSY